VSPVLRRTLRLIAAISLAIVTFVSVAVSGVIVTTMQATASSPASAGRDLPTSSASNPGGPVVVPVALGSTHTIASDYFGTLRSIRQLFKVLGLRRCGEPGTSAA
jgi:hypothetical protein